MTNLTLTDGGSYIMTDMGEQNHTDNYYEYDEYLDDVCNNASAMEFGKVFLPTLYSLVFILGIIGNGLVVCVLIIHHNQTNLTDICLFNLALADLLFVLSLPFYAHYAAIGQWIFGDLTCRLASGFYNMGFYSSVFSMLAMTLDRYAVVMHTHTVARYRTLRMGLVLTLAIWMLSLVISLPTLVFTQVKNESCNLYPDNHIWKEYKVLVTNIVGLVVPLLVMGFCYSRIIPTLINMKTVKKHRVVKMIIIIVVIFFCFWTPYNTVLFLEFLTSRNEWETDCDDQTNMSLSMQVTEAIAFTHCCLNPIIYAFAGQKFMQRVLKLVRAWLPWCFPHRHPSRDFSETTVRKSSVMSKSSATSTFM